LKSPYFDMLEKNKIVGDSEFFKPDWNIKNDLVSKINQFILYKLIFFDSSQWFWKKNIIIKS
jgi:hypothetical protein